MSNRPYKVIVIGNTNTGKTSIIHQYTRGNFPEAHFTTPLPIEHSKSVNNVNLDIWDTAGAEEWQSMNSSVYHGSDAVIYLCSYDEQQSLNDLKDVWFQMVAKYLSPDVPSILAVNKSDLPDDQRLIEENGIESIRKEINAFKTIYVSAKENINVNELFKEIAEKLSNSKQKEVPKPVIIDKPGTKTKGESGCC